MDDFKPRQIFNGAFAKLYFDGEILMEAKAAEATIEGDWEEITLPGGKKGQQLKGRKGVGKFTVHKVNSIEYRKFFSNMKAGKITDFSIETTFDGPQTLGAERISLPDCEFTGNLNLFNYSVDSLIEKEFEFMFDPDTADAPEIV
ncbi:MAG: phage tail tube protein [Cetobacterium sp.]|uniref:phage tail tube protein n=1 Tax=Cetobacterium sp. TaxID=2071632 RepID=UPI003A9C14D9